ncbi:hypothetical protein [Burkholderia gladioli]|uniref:hypothetical protein n=1 Tax=Burkholderia gladioli TaxID=28095 RepID=UPI00163E70E8|nr:hypothetical protein [Burkholderia gladioli]
MQLGKREIVLGLLILMIVFLGSCSSSRPIDTSFVAERWRNSIASFNLDAVFPPRHMEPGEIYLVMQPPAHLDDTAKKYRYHRKALYLGRPDVRRSMELEADTTLHFPANNGTGITSNVFAPLQKKQLSPVGFGGVNISEVTEADLGISFPVRAFRAIFGAAGGSSLVMSISIPKGEEMKMGAMDAYDSLAAFCWPKDGTDKCDISAPQMRMAIASITDTSAPQTEIPTIVIVTQVFYARDIEYTYTTSGGAALNLKATLAAANAGKNPDGTLPNCQQTQASQSGPSEREGNSQTDRNQKKFETLRPAATQGASSTQPASTPQAQEPGQPSTPVNPAGQIAQNELCNAGNAAPDTTGGRLSVAHADENGTILRQTFDDPVAIGYRGLAMFPINYPDEKAEK